MKLDPRLSRLIGWVRVHQTWLTMLLTAIVLTAAGFALVEILKEVRVADIRAAFGRITPHQVLLVPWARLLLRLPPMRQACWMRTGWRATWQSPVHPHPSKTARRPRANSVACRAHPALFPG